MLVLGIDSSGHTASAALYEDGIIKCEYSANIGLTHSQTLLPMVAEIFSRSGKTVKDLDLIAVSAGPGSFTGLRIGAAAAKGLSLPYEIPLAQVSTMRAISFNLIESPYPVRVIMDARRNQVYTGLYLKGEVLEDERAMDILELLRETEEKGDTVIFTGDGVLKYRNIIDENLKIEHEYAAQNNILQRASSVAILGEKLFNEGKAVDGGNFKVSYLRKPQAIREREAKGIRDFDIANGGK